MEMNYLEISVEEEERYLKLDQHELDLIDSSCELDEQTTPLGMGSQSKIGEQIHILLHPNYQVLSLLWRLTHPQ